ncbi:hypothetical protein B0T26DRAFT_753311 [Lasiosphaeria miniovina]|uniref:Uncharacterized protein n=1 Tax=Lasiosphaeria miniovina TaxID=1954250 RepID=A0AA40AC78_9PEZI|nr:uncharacterized protein B0T26DRAFT_753311 [Lasiosphaeria miniovina]KAK0713171.1 hypothetical protein B0T26DRAFT_753311 [Lasiosphaeria miniovina]
MNMDWDRQPELSPHRHHHEQLLQPQPPPPQHYHPVFDPSFADMMYGNPSRAITAGLFLGVVGTLATWVLGRTLYASLPFSLICAAGRWACRVQVRVCRHLRERAGEWWRGGRGRRREGREFWTAVDVRRRDSGFEGRRGEEEEAMGSSQSDNGRGGGEKWQWVAKIFRTRSRQFLV